MVSTAGLAAAYPGYQRARLQDNTIAQGDINVQNAQLDQQGGEAWGKTIPVLQQMLMPGAQSTASPPPMPPMPGQPSTSSPQTAGGPQPGMLSAPPPAGDPTWSVGASQAGAASPQQGADFNSRFGGQPPAAPRPPMGVQVPGRQPVGAASQGAMPQGQAPGGQQPQQGRLDLHTIMGAVVAANPGAKPQVIAAAVAKAMPLMTAQAQLDYKTLLGQLAAGRLGEQQTHHQVQEGQGAQRVEQGAGRLAATESEYDSRDTRRKAQTEQGAQRLDQSERRLQLQPELAKLSADTRRQIAEMREKGLTERTGLTLEARKEVGRLNAATKLEVLGIVEEGKDSRFAASEEGRYNRQGIAERNRNARFTEGQTQQNERQVVAERGRADRAELSANTRSDIARLSREAQREIADNLESGRMQRAELSNGTRSEIAKLNVESRSELAAALERGRSERFDAAEAGRNQRSQTLESGRDTRSALGRESREGIAANRESGLSDRFAARQQFLSSRIELQNKEFERRVARDKTLQDSTDNRRLLKLMEDENNAEYRRAQLKIQASNTMQPSAREKLRQDAESAYQNARAKIDQYKSQMGGSTAPAGAEAPPPEAIKALKEGHVTTFSNGQRWTLQGGKPVRAP